jgi:hypothetical protein
MVFDLSKFVAGIPTDDDEVASFVVNPNTTAEKGIAM